MKTQRILISTLVILFLVSPGIAAADDKGNEAITQTSAPINSTKTNRPAKVNEKMMMLDDKKAAIQEIKEKRQEAKEEFKDKKLEFKNKLGEIKDSKKRNLIERIDGKLNDINIARTDKMAEGLDRLEEFLTKIEERITNAEENGKDTTAAKTAYDKAVLDLETARNAVSDQAAKDYTPTLTDDENFTQPIGTMFSQLQQDLRAVYEQINMAKKSMILAARETVKLGVMSEDKMDNSASSSASNQTDSIGQ